MNAREMERARESIRESSDSQASVNSERGDTAAERGTHDAAVVRDTAQPSPYADAGKGYTHEDAIRDLRMLLSDLTDPRPKAEARDRLASHITRLEAEREQRPREGKAARLLREKDERIADLEAALDKAHADLAELREAVEMVLDDDGYNGLVTLRAVLDRQERGES